MGRLTENSVINIKNKSHSVTAEVDVPEARRRGRDRRPGRQHRRLEPLRQGRQADVLLQLLGLAALHVEADDPLPAGDAPGADGVRLRRRRPRQGRRRHALRRRQARSARAGRAHRSRWSSRSTRRLRRRQRCRRARRPTTTARTGNAFTGTVNWVQIDARRRRPRPPIDPSTAPDRHGPAVGLRQPDVVLGQRSSRPRARSTT